MRSPSAPPASADAAAPVVLLPNPEYRDKPAGDMPPGAVLIEAPCRCCGYTLRGLTIEANCPECGTPVAQSVTGVGRAAVSTVGTRWALAVVAGLIGLILLCPSQLWVALEMRFGDAAFGSATRLNVPGPKVWATTLVQRSLGYRPEWLGVQGTWLTLLGLAGVYLITAPRVDLPARTDRLRLVARWMPVVLAGGFFGFLVNAEYLYESDVAVGKYATVGVIGVELPGSLLLMAYLAHLARGLGRPDASRMIWIAAGAQALCMIVGIGMAMIAKDLDTYRHGLVVQLWSSLYGAACIASALLVLGSLLRLIGILIPHACPPRLAAWLATKR